MSFGSNLKVCRIARELSQSDLAKLAGTTKQVISLYELGERVPKIDVASRYAALLNVPLKYLINDLVDMQIWEHESLIEDYWRSSPSERLSLVTHQGLDPRIAADYERVSNLAHFAKTEFSLQDDEQRLISLYRSVNAEGKRHIAKQAEFAATQPEYRTNPTSSAKSVG